jgi:hypothetical protein
MWNRIHHPLWYQGVKKTRNYFEGWYFKQVTADRTTTLSLIPGISKSASSPHAFLHVILSKVGQPKPQTWYLAFEPTMFNHGDEPFYVEVGAQRFSETAIRLDLSKDDLTLVGTIRLEAFLPIGRSGPFPTIMGPFAYVPFMECYHGVVSMDHGLDGRVVINGEAIDFQGGRGYLEKDWGASFPEEYVWIQTNHFDKPGTSLMASVAKIPFLGLTFSGFLVNFVVDGTEYRFATYNGSKAKKLQSKDNEVMYRFTRGRFSLQLRAVSERVASLPAPKNGNMDHAIKEGLSGTVEVSLIKGDQRLFQGVGTQAGIEIATLEKRSK